MRIFAGNGIAAVIFTGAGLIAAGFITAANAGGSGQGPVASACQDEIAKLCPGIAHGGGRVRACLESNKDKASAACQQALATHGPGRGAGQGNAQK